MLECGCVKISVALLRQPFQPFLSFFQTIECMRLKLSVSLLRHHFVKFSKNELQLVLILALFPVFPTTRPDHLSTRPTGIVDLGNL